MMGPETILMGLGGVGLVGALFIFLPKLFGRSGKNKILDQFKKDEKQKRLQDEVKVISKEQKVIAAQIEASEHASEETKEKIKKKLQKAAVEIQETLKEDSLSAIDSQIDEDWEGM
jgi:galactokinase/mevalonate kinase-like predicted kinase